MEIARATPADAAALAFLENSCFPDAWTSTTLTAALEDERYVILFAREGDAVFGYALGWSVAEEAELARVGVLALRRGQGIGALLTRAIVQVFQSRGVEAVFLEVRESNFPARRVYEKCNFIEVGKRPNYYANGETAIVMRAELC